MVCSLKELSREEPMNTSLFVILDIWVGENSSEHIARFILPLGEALEKAKKELTSGALVNLRREHLWGAFTSFDRRN